VLARSSAAVSLLSVTACLSVASIDDFPKTANAIDFDRLSKQSFDSDQSFWTFRSEYEHFVGVEKVTEDKLVSAITKALQAHGYGVSHTSLEKVKGSVIGERGLRSNEWASIVAAYYRINEKNAQVYFRNKITQDITGGARKNGAREVAGSFCTFVLCERE